MLAVISSIISFLIVLFLSLNSLALEVKCQDPANCHPSVVALEIELTPPEAEFSHKKFDYCSGFLIAPDKVMTNGHCVYGRIGYPSKTRVGQSCLSVKVHFPKASDGRTQFAAETVGCRLLETTTDWDPRMNQSIPDFAVLLINPPVKRPHIKVWKFGVDDDAIHKSIAYDFTPNGDDMIATQRVDMDCKVDMSNEVRPFYSRYSPMIFYNNCSLIPGNSGSVLLNSKGEAVALAQAMTLLSGKKTNAGEIFLDSGLATNLSCVDTVSGTEINEGIKKECNIESFEKTQNSFVDAIYARLDLKISQNLNPEPFINEVVQHYKSMGDIKYERTMSYTEKDASYIRFWSLTPVCFNREFIEKLGFKKASTAASIIEIKGPMFLSQGSYSKSYRFAARNPQIVAYTMEIELPSNISATLSSDQVSIGIREVINGSRAPQGRTKEIPFCK